VPPYLKEDECNSPLQYIQFNPPSLDGLKR
jgi:hypothetical protein